MLASKPTVAQQAATAAGPEDEKLKKYATAVVEFGKVINFRVYLSK